MMISNIGFQRATNFATPRLGKFANLLLFLGGGLGVVVLLHHPFLAIAIVGGVLTAILKLPIFARINLAMAGLCCGFLIYAAEMGLELYGTAKYRYNQEAVRRLAESNAGRFDNRTEREVLRDLRQISPSVYQEFFPGAMLVQSDSSTGRSRIQIRGIEVLPLGGIANATIVSCNENGIYQIYDSDEHGFRNPKGIWGHGPIEVLAIGDSIAHDDCLPSDLAMMGQIRRQYPATLSLGAGGNGPLLELAAFHEYAAKLRPKVVLWLFCEYNDIPDDLDREVKSPLLMKYLNGGFDQHLIERQSDINRALQAFSEREYEKHRLTDETQAGVSHQLLRFAELEELRLAWWRSRNRPKPHLDVFQQALTSVKEAISSWNGRLYLVYLPAFPRYRKIPFESQNIANYDQIHTQVIDMMSKLSIPVIDVFTAFQIPYRNGVKLVYPYIRSHYTPEGYRIAAQTVLDSLTASGQLENSNGK